MNGARLLRAADYRRVRWKNDGGWTTELAASPAADGGFDWRVSIAEVERDGAFSAFPGCDRHIALLEGAGMELQFGGDTPPITLDQRLRFHAFSGDAAAYGRLLAGPVRDFNVIVRRERIEASVLHRPLVGPMVFLPDAATTWLVHLLGGRAELKDIEGFELAAGESLLLEPDAAARNRVLSGGGEVVIVKLSQR